MAKVPAPSTVSSVMSAPELPLTVHVLTVVVVDFVNLTECAAVPVSRRSAKAGFPEMMNPPVPLPERFKSVTYMLSPKSTNITAAVLFAIAIVLPS